MKVDLVGFDIERVKEIAVMEGKDPETLTEVQIWEIVSHALRCYEIDLLTHYAKGRDE
ncbi:hypothetical protein J23TS9_06590 [Paenibacillus sp. J23TS9]|uniref:hypothetical protein n=1 Tax=Paenibacillus sp. J23TS9 TaxID=2807193 RepID=UPI001B2CC585|nr:hypothetical protein [Paenibacillus sp. J23TS9]GIP25529.1 hypothetical protein J23TS9_06590 [Paenibacillus sp. J23TS9]